MVIHRNEMKIEEKESLRDGYGKARITHLDEKAAGSNSSEPGGKHKNTRLLAEIILEPGASIGYHRHDSETEYYFIIEGNGVVNDDGVELKVSPGDAVITGNGASHAIKNTGTDPLVFHAVIILG